MTKCSDCFYADTMSHEDPCATCIGFAKYVSADAFKDEKETVPFEIKPSGNLNLGFSIPSPWATSSKYYGNPITFEKPMTMEHPDTPLSAGKKYDSGKPDWSLLPFKAVSETVEVLTFGANKYGPDNWRIVPNAKKRYLAAAFRHIVAYATGEKKDSESGLSHLSHALCCLMFILELEKTDDTSNT